MAHFLMSFLLAAIVYATPAPTPAPSASPVPPPMTTTSGTPWRASEITAMRRAIDRLMAAPTLRGAQIGLIATDTMRGTPLYSLNADQDFMPASNFKLLVGSAALARLGPAFHYTTVVAASGAPTGGVLHGDLYLRGGGDALLSARDLDEAAAALAARGITRIDGSVVTDATHFDDHRYEDGWSWDDLPYYYAPPVTALELEDGTVHMTFAPGAAPGMPATLRVWPQADSDAYDIDNQLATGPSGSKDTSDIARPWDAPRTIRITGSYPLGAKESGDVSPSVPDPQAYAGRVLMRALAAHGIAVGGTLRAGSTPANAPTLWTHDSEAMPKLLSDFWEPSDNLMGEMFIKQLGVLQGGEPGTVDHGRIVEEAYLRSIGIDPSTVTISDGSGLSQYDRITPRALATILQSDWNGPNRQIVLDALPVAGSRGTLSHLWRGTPAAGAVYAKTGSISHVRTISGFVRTKTHGAVTFSLLVNQWMGEDLPHGAHDLAAVRGAILSEFAKR